MNKRLKKGLLGFLVVLFILCIGGTCHAESNESGDAEVVLTKKRATAYCLDGRTYTGKRVRDGIVACGDKSLVGRTLILYQRLPDGSVGEIIGIYECEDTGCSEHVIDIWCEDLEACQAMMDRVYEDGCQGKIYIQVLEAEG